MKIFLSLLFLFAFLSAQTNQMNIDGKPEKSSTEMVGVRDDNGRICAMIKIVSDMDGFSYDSYNGVVKVDDKPGEDLVYLQPNERVLEIFKSGFEPLKIILSEYGIQLKERDVWQIKISGEDKMNQLPVVIITRPEGSRVFIDGKNKGLAEKHTLSRGAHSIRLIKQGYEPVAETIQVDKNNTLFKYNLKEIEDVPIQITSVPSGATVYIDNVKFGTTPLSDFYPSGKYPIRIENDWYVTYDDFIDIKAPQTPKEFTLREDFGSLTVTSAPQSGLDIYVNGQLFKYKTPHTFNRLKPGIYRIKARSQYYKTAEQSIEIKRGADQKIDLVSSGNFAILSIKTDPGVLIYLNNKKITNFKDIRLEPSIVKVRAERPPKGKPVEKRVILKKNDNITVDISPEIATGTIQVAVVPFDANVNLKGDAGEFYSSNKSKAFKNIPVGMYDLTVKKNGYETQTAKLILNENETIKRNIRLQPGSSVALSSSKGGSASSSGGNAFVKSLFIPGMGQISNGHKRGWFYTLATLGAAGWYYSAYSAHSENMDAYNSTKDIFESSQTVENALAVNKAVEKTDESYQKGMNALYALGGVYAINLLDALLFSSKKETKNYSIKPHINSSRAIVVKNIESLQFGLIVNW